MARVLVGVKRVIDYAVKVNIDFFKLSSCFVYNGLESRRLVLSSYNSNEFNNKKNIKSNFSQVVKLKILKINF